MSLSVLVSLGASHAPAIAVAAPLIAAVVILLTPGPRAAFAVVGLAVFVAAAAAVTAFLGVLSAGPVAYVLTEGLTWRIDAWSAAIVALAFVTLAPAVLAGGAGVLRSPQPGLANFAFAAALIVASAMAAAAYAAHLALLVLAVQAAGLAFTVLIASGADGARAPPFNAALRALAAFGVAGALMWFGVGLMLAGAGAADPAAVFVAGAPGQAAVAGLLLAGMGLALVGLVSPMDHWGAAVVTRGPHLAGMAAAALIGPLAFAALARVMSQAADLGAGLAAGVIFIVLGGAGALVAAVQALAARDLRRLAGYAFAAQLGCALIGLALATPEGAAAAALKVAGAALAALLLLGAGAVEPDLERLDGLARRAPVAALCAALGCFLLMSAPFTLGYAGSWALVEASLARGWWAGAALTVAVSLAGVVFGGRLLERIYFRAPHGEPRTPAAPLQGFGLVALAVLAVAAGFAGGPLTDWAQAAGYALWAWPAGAPTMAGPP